MVLSRYLVQGSLGDRPAAWIFLDDYAGWLGQEEGRIADLLCLSPATGPSGERLLDVIVTEAKYVKASSVGEKADRSAVQLKATLKRLERALREDDGPVDGTIWRSRLAEMLQDAMGDHVVSGPDWRTAIREGGCSIRLAGFSHVFTHGSGELAEAASDALTGVPDTATGLQERYSPATLRELVRAYADCRDPTPIRERLEGQRGSESAGVVASDAAPAVQAPGAVDPEVTVAFAAQSSASAPEVPLRSTSRPRRRSTPSRNERARGQTSGPSSPGGPQRLTRTAATRTGSRTSRAAAAAPSCGTACRPRSSRAF